MAIFIMTDAKTLIGGYDLSGVTNNLTLTHSKELLDGTTFGFADNTRVRIPGLLNVELSQSGYVDHVPRSGDQEKNMFDAVADITETVVCLASTGSISTAPGPELANPGFAFKALQGTYNVNSSVAEIQGYDLTAQGTDRIIRGYITENAATGRGSSGNSSGYNAGAGTGKTLYSVLQVVDADASGTLDVEVHSAATDSWPGTQHAVHTQHTVSVGAEWVEVDVSAETDAWWRMEYTIATPTDTFLFYHMFALV